MKGEKKVDFGRQLLSWKSPEYRHHERGSTWVFFASFFSLLLVGFAIWQDTYELVVAMLLIAGIYFLTHNKKPRDIEISITSNGIVIDGNFSAFSQIEAFWIYFDPSEDLKCLNLLFRSGLIRERVLDLMDIDPDEIRAAMSGRVFEWEGRTEGFLEKLIRLLKL